MKFTKRTVDGLMSDTKDSFYLDEELKGFGVKVPPAGKKVFVLQMRLNGNLNRFTIGTYGAPWSTDSAREEAKRMLGEIVKGVDPHDEKRSRRNDITVLQLADLYWEVVAAHKKPITIANEKGGWFGTYFRCWVKCGLRKYFVQIYKSLSMILRMGKQLLTSKRRRAAVPG